jgi:hypothetical protein
VRGITACPTSSEREEEEEKRMVDNTASATFSHFLLFSFTAAITTTTLSPFFYFIFCANKTPPALRHRKSGWDIVLFALFIAAAAWDSLVRQVWLVGGWGR